MRIGIDIGGTHTDIVLVDAYQQRIYGQKCVTTPDIISGIRTALMGLCQAHPTCIPALKGVFIGTTFGLNALLQAAPLAPVALLRIDNGTLDSIPVAHGWPRALKAYVPFSASFAGGAACDGRLFADLDLAAIRDHVGHALDRGIRAFAVSSPFAPLYPSQTQIVKALILEQDPQATVTLCADVGGMGIFARENAALCNSMLAPGFSAHFAAIGQIMAALGITCPLWISQNNGTTMPLARALAFPIWTLSSGPTNAFVGAARLTGLQDAIVIDVGGTSTDMGVLQGGYPIPANRETSLQGMRFNFSMPDMRSIALGGGSIIHPTEGLLEQSVGAQLTQQSQCFGGPTLTLTDAALRCGYLQIAGAHLPKLRPDWAARYMQAAAAKIHQMIEARPIFAKLPCIVVGGGAALWPPGAFGAQMLVPEGAALANAFGAALSELSCSADCIVDTVDVEEKIQALSLALSHQLRDQGVQAPTIRCMDIERMPFHYLPKPATRLRVTMVGAL